MLNTTSKGPSARRLFCAGSCSLFANAGLFGIDLTEMHVASSVELRDPYSADSVLPKGVFSLDTAGEYVHFIQANRVSGHRCLDSVHKENA